MTTQRLHSFQFTLVNKDVNSTARLRRMPFSNLVHMHTRCLIPRPKTWSLVWEVRLVHMSKHGWHKLFGGSRRAHKHHVGKVLHSVAYL